MSLMDRISELPDDLLLRVLSLLPDAKDVVSTMVLSKRWQFLWMSVPRLVYDDSYQNIEYGKFSRFVDRSLIVHETPVIETLHFKLGKTCSAEDLKVWIRAANKCSVRDLIIEFYCPSKEPPVIVPRILYTGCTKMLVKLRLNNVILVNFSSPVSFPSLKTLSLILVKYPDDQFVSDLLSNCHVLEELDVERCLHDNVTVFDVRVPSLKGLVFYSPQNRDSDDEDGYVINAPSLEYLALSVEDGFCIIENEMPNIAKAYLDVTHSHPGEILSSFTSVKRLYCCLSTSKDLYPVGTVFDRLVYLTLCTCEAEWLNLLMCMLSDCPKLGALKLEQYSYHRPHQTRPLWNEPSSVPECVLSSLETLEWAGYGGTEAEKEVVKFMLRNGSSLKKVTISSKSTEPDKKFEMMKELTLFIRRSPTCQLAFD
ncbi:putative FBD-associated F-box protein At5g50270 isoform X1 [Eutrema salsugineum]|uniref:putative FBD-associated F-box protein At5g50270 isoform X1 n=1 Tax=Eutrema salsugineum TaxID=72664 RepID=UPI000CED3CFE|nr:putative FBD-associated F-box protein At5g50270 isoform X1 [Eutrema salsugineum]